MAFVPINFVGTIGVIRDREPHTLPPNAWSEGQNIRLNDGSAKKIAGHKEVYATPSVAPYELFYVPDPNQQWWVYAGLVKVYATDQGSSHANISRQVSAPGACTAALAGAGAGNLDNDTYSYKVTFVNANGETEAGTASNVVTVVDNATDGQIALTGIPTSSEDTVTARKVYRTEGGGSEYKLLTTINDNSTTTFTDNVADGSLGAAAPSTNDADWDYQANADVGWSGGVLNGVPVLNNSVDDPQMWLPVGSGTRLQKLTGWNSNWKAKVIRPFKNFLIALDVTKSGTRFPYMVKWSHTADPGSVPASWDEADATKDAGEFELGDTPDYLIDGLGLRDRFIVYKEKTTYIMQFVGGQFIFANANISKLDGIFSRRCATEFRPGMHAVLTHNDFVTHNGFEAQSVIDGANRDWLFSLIDSTNYARTFVAHNEPKNEVWICFPEQGESFCTRALIWNYRENTWGDRELPDVTSIKPGVVTETVVDTWDGGFNISWDSQEGIDKWNQDRAAPTENRLLGAGPNDTKLYWMDTGAQFDGTSYDSRFERIGLPISGLNREGSATMNFESFKFLRGVRGRFKAQPSTDPVLYIATRAFVGASDVWYGPYVFSPDTGYKVDVTLSARLFGYRVEIDADDLLEMDGIDFDIDVQAQY